MARHYVIQDWSNSASWSGEMIGNRLSGSEGHFLKGGKANTSLYAGDEEESTKKTKRPPLSIADKILPQERRLNLLDDQEAELYAARDTMTAEKFDCLLTAIQIKRERTFKSLMKAQGIDTSSNEEKILIDMSKGNSLSYKKSSKIENIVYAGLCLLVACVMMYFSN